MEFLLFIALIFYIVKAVKNAKEVSAKKAAARARAAAMAAAAERQRESESAPTVHTPVQPRVQPTPEPRLSTPQQRRHTLQPSGSSGHSHTESSMTGFSDHCPPGTVSEQRPIADRLAAFKAEKRAAEQAARRAARVDTPAPTAIDLDAPAQSAFRFDPLRAREGLIYAEILGKPKALRR